MLRVPGIGLALAALGEPRSDHHARCGPRRQVRPRDDGGAHERRLGARDRLLGGRPTTGETELRKTGSERREAKGSKARWLAPPMVAGLTFFCQHLGEGIRRPGRLGVLGKSDSSESFQAIPNMRFLVDCLGHSLC